jgi:hypothetical protein
MRLVFIEKLFTNCEIRTSMQTRYLCFKGISYESENYLCDISCVQLWKSLTQFWCGNMQLEVVLSAWKGVPYAKRFCWGYDLGKVEDEEHLLLVYPKHKMLENAFVRPYPSPTLALLLSSCDYEHSRPGQVCGMLLGSEDNLSSMICLSSNGLFGPKWT